MSLRRFTSGVSVLCVIGACPLHADGVNVEPAPACLSATHGLRAPVPPGWTQMAEESLTKSGEGVLCGFYEDSEGSTSSIYVTWTDVGKPITAQECAVRARDTVDQQRASGLVEVVEIPLAVTLGDRRVVRNVIIVGNEAFIYYQVPRGSVVYSVSGSFPRETWRRYDTLMKTFVAQLELDEETQVSGLEAASVEDLVRLGTDYYAAGQLDESIKVMELALTKGPSLQLETSILASLSSSYFDKGQLPYAADGDDSLYQQSIKYSKECLALDPTFWLVLGNLAVVHMNMGQLAEADYYFTEAKKIADEHDPGYHQLLGQHELLKQMKALREGAP